MPAGTAQRVLNLGDLRQFDIALPPQLEQRKIVAGIKAETGTLTHGAQTAQREISLLREYRTRLIADVVTGKLDVREAALRLPGEVDEPEPLGEAEADAEDATADDLDTTPEEAEA